MITSIKSTLCEYVVGVNCDEIIRSEQNDTEQLTCYIVVVNGVYTYVSLLEHEVNYESIGQL